MNVWRLLSREYNHHDYTKAFALAVHAMNQAMKPLLWEQRLSIQPYFDRGQGRHLKCVSRLWLSEFSYNASSVRYGVIVYKDWPVSEWIIIKMGSKVTKLAVINKTIKQLSLPHTEVQRSWIYIKDHNIMLFISVLYRPISICANTTSAPLICSNHGYHLRQNDSLFIQS